MDRRIECEDNSEESKSDDNDPARIHFERYRPGHQSGDWVESCTALVEHHDGSFEVLYWTDKEVASKKLDPPQASNATASKAA